MKTATKSKRVEKSRDAAAASNDKIIFIALEDLLPNPYQPASRGEVDPETAKKFALSIQEHGLIQTPVVRAGKEAGKYEIGDGWLRRAGFAYLASNITASPYRQMPCVVRQLTDQQMADMVLEANTVRKDLNPIELARLYKQYLDDFKIPQVELARHHNCSQGEIANTIRLLELPVYIQQKIISQEISETHGRQLLRLNHNPDLQKSLLKNIIEKGYSVSDLDNVIARSIYETSKNLDRQDYPNPNFDTAACETCTHRQKLGNPYMSKKKTWRCMNRECYDQKQKKAEDERQAKVLAELQAARDAVRVQNEKAAGKKKGKNDIAAIDCSKLQYDDYRELEGHRKIDNPDECKTCPKRALGKLYGQRTELVCIDPKCFKKKEKAYEAKKAAEEREAEHKLGERIKVACERVGSDGTILRLVAQHFEQHSRKDTLEKVSRFFGLKDRDACFAVETESELTQRLAVMVVMKEHLEGDKGVFLQMLASLEGKTAELEKQIEDFRKKFCNTCEHEGGEYPCTMMRKQWADGECWRYRRLEQKSKKGKKVDRNVETEEKSSTGSEAQKLEDSLPCKTCANAETCDRSHFYADNKNGYVCDQKKELEEANV